LRREGELPFGNRQNYKFKALGFKELLEGTLLPVFIITDHLLVPRTEENLVERTNYKPKTVKGALGTLRYLGFIHREGKRYVLKGQKEKILELINAGLECKKRWIQKVRKFFKAKELFTQGFSISKISKEINLNINLVYNWLSGGYHPRLRPQTAKLLLAQKLFTETELSIWQREGILY
jgi:hypothetical protein